MTNKLTQTQLDSIIGSLVRAGASSAVIAETVARLGASIPTGEERKSNRKDAPPQPDEPKPEKPSEFVEHLKKLHERTPAEKAQAAADWHTFFDTRWEAWRNSDEYRSFTKKSQRSVANSAKAAELRAEWKALKASQK